MTGPSDDSAQAGRIGTVASIDGMKVNLALEAWNGRPNQRVTVGRFVRVRAGGAILVGIITTLASTGDGRSITGAVAGLDLLGEILSEGGAERFRRGVARYPAIGDEVDLLPPADVRVVHRVSGTGSVAVGTLYQDPETPACLKIDDLLSKHFAVLGATGVGKSSGVAVILDRVLAAQDSVRVFLLDVHNEYASCFGDRANIVTPRNLKLPFWLFNLEEIADVIYGGRPPIDEEIDILAEVIPLAKTKYLQYREASDRQLVKRGLGKNAGFTVDTPVPYTLQDLTLLIDERMGRLENRASRMHYHRLISRIETIRNDPRYGFMFENANVGGDMMGELLAHLFRLEPDGRPMTIMQLAGLPTEVVDAVVCVLCRLAFEFGIWSEGAVPLLLVCEEAHRYASADRSVGFTPTRRALSRIAREGRKHGVFLGLVTQRPAELDPAIISQCSTLFAMRMTNERDQAFLAAAVSDAANLLAFVPSLGTGEVIAFGEGVPLPARMTFSQLPPARQPRNDVSGRDADEGRMTVNGPSVGAVVERWRAATMSKPAGLEADGMIAARLSREPAAEPQGNGPALDQAHRRLLRRPLEAGDVPAPAPAEGGNRLVRALWQQG
ncbi:ATP-binding protein [Methylobacterium sp. NFXW15]|uniref:ATP-binding protein n=1 Tax=Methylobacterium sp. NFXW15 TaxID=2819512 RepID=UPI003CED8E85